MKVRASAVLLICSLLWPCTLAFKASEFKVGLAGC